MRVGFIFREHPTDEAACLVGGAAKSPYRLLLELRKHVHVTGVIATDQRGRTRSQGYDVFGFRVPGARLYLRTLLVNLFSLPRVVWLFARSDVIQCHHPHLGLGAAIVRRFFAHRVRFVLKAHGTAVPELDANRYRGLRGRILKLNARAHHLHDRFVIGSADRVLVSSDYQLDEMMEIYGADRHVLQRVYNGFDAHFRRVRSRDGVAAVTAPRLVFVGRLVPKKGFSHLSAVHEGLIARFPQLELTLVLGHRDRIEHVPTYRFVEEHLLVRPRCRSRFDLDEDELYRVLSSSDIGLVPSNGYESIPSVILEMGAVGLPVFATRQWGITEVLPVDFGLTGEPDEDVDRIASFIQTQLRDWDSSSWSRSFDNFAYERISAQYLEMYHELMGATDD